MEQKELLKLTKEELVKMILEQNDKLSLYRGDEVERRNVLIKKNNEIKRLTKKVGELEQKIQEVKNES